MAFTSPSDRLQSSRRPPAAEHWSLSPKQSAPNLGANLGNATRRVSLFGPGVPGEPSKLDVWRRQLQRCRRTSDRADHSTPGLPPPPVAGKPLRMARHDYHRWLCCIWCASCGPSSPSLSGQLLHVPRMQRVMGCQRSHGQWASGRSATRRDAAAGTGLAVSRMPSVAVPARPGKTTWHCSIVTNAGPQTITVADVRKARGLSAPELAITVSASSWINQAQGTREK